MNKDYYIFKNGRMKRKNNTFYFIDEEENKKSLPIHQMENIHVFGQVDFNTNFLNLLTQNDVRVHFYNYYGFYNGTYYPRSKNISGFTVVNQSRHYIEKDKREYLAKQFIYSGVFHMLRNLRNYKKYHEVETITDRIQANIKLLENVHRIPEIMGVEGTIRQLYYSAFNYFLPEEFAFDERTKRPPRDPLNALISFGNSMCYTTVLTEIYKTQVDPKVSFLHEPSTKRFSLSLDIAEIFKPLMVDPVIFALLNRKQIKTSDFEYMEKMVMLNESGRKKFIKEWTEKLETTIRHRKLKRNVSYRYFIRLECYKLIKHFIGDQQYKPLKAWW
ncbi:type I-B CRISPR-associated endonuclease Cas1b [Lederbergia sp. NSJ-179]|uniref:type I-B CRISPR-associated endonuclease Cas1b n=1 Tax=Lederbergia sp. NSJ-179 TaxID=2931402 RepID=UPI001FD24BE0|nr:type I-B CRISPR-associated endonuclease Cas1b [Lederbergia sp. NSJ-179]MCJ7843512.1 type I-B CRISPR-associated endonuclease Cas1b [Lederbergia sp. NSJ-179]